MQYQKSSDYPLEAVPREDRKSFLSVTSILLGFTFVTYTMLAGAELGASFSSWEELLTVIVSGSALLSAYAATICVISSQTGLTTMLLAKRSFGIKGSILVDIILGFTQIGWYAVGTTLSADLSSKLFDVPPEMHGVLICLFGILFCSTALIGYRGLEIFSYYSVPILLISMACCVLYGLNDFKVSQATTTQGTSSMSHQEAITLVVGTFVSGATQASNWARYAKSRLSALAAAVIAFFFGNMCMILFGAWGAYLYHEPDFVNVLSEQGFLNVAVVVFFLNLWSTQDNTIYNWSLAVAAYATQADAVSLQ